MKANLLVGAVGAALLITTGWAQTTSSTSEMPVLTGSAWQQMSENEKLAFVWGVAHVVDFERNIRAKAGATSQTSQKTLLPHIEKALKNQTFRSVVQDIDAYYARRPGQKDRPVLSALVTDVK